MRLVQRRVAGSVMAVAAAAAVAMWAGVSGTPRAAALPLHVHAAQGAAAFEGDVVVRAFPADMRQLRTLLAISPDMWSHGAAAGKPADFRFTREGLDALRASGVPFEILIPDLGALVAAEHARITAARAAAKAGEGGVAGGSWYDDVKDLGAINSRLDALAAQRPDIASLSTIGLSLEGRPIRVVRLSRVQPGARAPGIFVNATQHAREWATPMTAMYMVERLVEDADTDPRVSSLLDRAEVFIVAVCNPDGYEWSWASPANRLWRKNRRANGDGTVGVDLNRNWGWQWGGAGSSGNGSSETYRGPSAFSEPETQVLRDFVLSKPDIVMNIDLHSYSQLILSPWAWTTGAPPEIGLMQDVGDGMRDAIAASTGSAYIAGPVSTTLYLASGGSIDWMYGAGSILAWTVEVRDQGSYGFLIPPSEVLPCAVENWAALLAATDRLAQGAAISLPQGVPPTAEPGTVTAVRVDVRDQLGLGIASRTVRWRVDGGAWLSADLASGQSGLVAELPAAPCGSAIEFYIEVQPALGPAVRYPVSAPDTALQIDVRSQQVAFSDDFESDLGWTFGLPGDTATSGAWVRGVPVPTSSQPGSGHTPDGTQCAFTGQGVPGGPDGAADVDGGFTTLQSPPLGTVAQGAVIEFWFWFANHLGASPGNDPFRVDVSGDGITWVTAYVTTLGQTAWRHAALSLDGLLDSGSNVRVRFVAADFGPGSLVEAAVDDVALLVPGCGALTADLNGDGLVNGEDLAILLSCWGSACGDITGNGMTDGADLGALLSAWSP
jgi:murein tripeptide amidase MpaA